MTVYFCDLGQISEPVNTLAVLSEKGRKYGKYPTYHCTGCGVGTKCMTMGFANYKVIHYCSYLIVKHWIIYLPSLLSIPCFSGED